MIISGICLTVMTGVRKHHDQSILKVTIRIMTPKERSLKKNAPELFISTREGKGVKVSSEDQARFGRINNVNYCWVPPHLRAQVKQQMVREHVYAFTVSPQARSFDGRVL